MRLVVALVSDGAGGRLMNLMAALMDFGPVGRR